jgi:protein subunit release factor A
LGLADGMSDIQEEAYSEAMDEIERLKDKIRGLEKLNQMTDEEVIMQLKAEIAQLKSLLTRAAEALEDEFGSPNDPAYGIKGPVHELISELRKAAQ